MAKVDDSHVARTILQETYTMQGDQHGKIDVCGLAVLRAVLAATRDEQPPNGCTSPVLEFSLVYLVPSSPFAWGLPFRETQ